MNTKIFASAFAGAFLFAGAAVSGDAALSVKGANQDMSAGTVTATEIKAGENGWMVVHAIKPNGKPGPVIGHAPLAKGVNNNVTAILTRDVPKGEKLMLMLHAEKGGNKTGIFEYTLGAKEDGPIKVDGGLVMAIVESL